MLHSGPSDLVYDGNYTVYLQKRYEIGTFSQMHITSFQLQCLVGAG